MIALMLKAVPRGSDLALSFSFNSDATKNGAIDVESSLSILWSPFKENSGQEAERRNTSQVT